MSLGRSTRMKKSYIVVEHNDVWSMLLMVVYLATA